MFTSGRQLEHFPFTLYLHTMTLSYTVTLSLLIHYTGLSLYRFLPQGFSLTYYSLYPSSQSPFWKLSISFLKALYLLSESFYLLSESSLQYLLSCIFLSPSRYVSISFQISLHLLPGISPSPFRYLFISFQASLHLLQVSLNLLSGISPPSFRSLHRLSGITSDCAAFVFPLHSFLFCHL